MRGMDRCSVARHRSVMKVVHGSRGAEHRTEVPKWRSEICKTWEATHFPSELIAVGEHFNRINITRIQIRKTTFQFGSVSTMSRFDIQGSRESSR